MPSEKPKAKHPRDDLGRAVLPLIVLVPVDVQDAMVQDSQRAHIDGLCSDLEGVTKR
jgi:hypothetical protein